MIRLAALLVMLAGPAAAHGTLPGAGGFYNGAAHPLMALDHLLALLAAGMLAGSQPRGAVPLLPGLLAGVAVGLWLGAAGWPVPPRAVILPVTLGLGAALLALRPLPVLVPGVLLALLGLAIGADSDVPPGWAARLGLGVGIMLITLNAAALAGAVSGRAPLVLRIAGSWICAVVVLLLALAAVR